MTKLDVKSAEVQRTLEEIYDHLITAQSKMDQLEPDSIFGARIQHLIDDVLALRGIETGN